MTGHWRKSGSDTAAAARQRRRRRRRSHGRLRACSLPCSLPAKRCRTKLSASARPPTGLSAPLVDTTGGGPGAGARARPSTLLTHAGGRATSVALPAAGLATERLSSSISGIAIAHAPRRARACSPLAALGSRVRGTRGAACGAAHDSGSIKLRLEPVHDACRTVRTPAPAVRPMPPSPPCRANCQQACKACLERVLRDKMHTRGRAMSSVAVSLGRSRVPHAAARWSLRHPVRAAAWRGSWRALLAPNRGGAPARTSGNMILRMLGLFTVAFGRGSREH